MKKQIQLFTFLVLTISMPQLLADEEAAEMAGERAEREQTSRSTGGEGGPVKEEIQFSGGEHEFVAGERTGNKLSRFRQQHIQTALPATEPHIASPTASPITSTPSASPVLQSPPSVVEPQRAQSAPTPVTHEVETHETLYKNFDAASNEKNAAFRAMADNPTTENKAKYESAQENLKTARTRMNAGKPAGVSNEAVTHNVERVFGARRAQAHHF